MTDCRLQIADCLNQSAICNLQSAICNVNTDNIHAYSFYRRHCGSSRRYLSPPSLAVADCSGRTGPGDRQRRERGQRLGPDAQSLPSSPGRRRGRDHPGRSHLQKAGHYPGLERRRSDLQAGQLPTRRSRPGGGPGPGKRRQPGRCLLPARTHVHASRRLSFSGGHAAWSRLCKARRAVSWSTSTPRPPPRNISWLIT